jgi:hypothetical protein
MNTSERILNGVKQALTEGEAKVNLFEEQAQDVKEASNLTGSGLNIGGRVDFDDAFAALRLANPFRIGARQIIAKNTSATQFVAKTGNAANSTNPWTYAVVPNSGSPNIATSFWQLPTRVITAQLPIRTAALSDINGIEEALTKDLILEFSQLEAASMALNNDQTGTTSTATGGVNGLRGLITYLLSSTTAQYGTSGTAITNGIHTVVYESVSATAPTYDDLVATLNKLPPQYWYRPNTAWHMHPALIAKFREMKATGGQPLLLEVGDGDGGAVVHIFGIPVIPNPYLAAPATNALMGVLADWDEFLTIADAEEMNIKMFDQTQPGFMTMYAEKRLVSTVRNPFAGVYMIGA